MSVCVAFWGTGPEAYNQHGVDYDAVHAQRWMPEVDTDKEQAEPQIQHDP